MALLRMALGSLLLMLVILHRCNTSASLLYNSSKQRSSSLIPMKKQVHSVCNSKFTAFRGNVFCEGNLAFVFIGHCFGHIEFNQSIKLGLWGSHRNFTGYVVSRCPYYAGSKTHHLAVPVVTAENNINAQFCQCLSDSNRAGFLCQDCDQDFNINIISPNFQCKNCSSWAVAASYMELLAATLLPLTLLFFIIVIFHIGLTSAPTNAYIFFSHVITLKLNILILESGWANTRGVEKYSKDLSKILFFPLYVWNLDFAYYTNPVSCVGNPKIMYIIFFNYLYAIYPMGLLLVTFFLVKLHGRNFKPVVLLWKPFCYLCVRLRSNWNIRTSLIDAFATCILLSYSKLIDVSLALISPNPVYDQNGTTVYSTLHYDISTQFLSPDHTPFFIIAIIVLTTLGLIPPVLLTLYPFQWFQKFLNALRLNRVQSLFIFLDAFQGCYKNGTNGSPERRYFAGFYFIMRIIVVFITSLGYLTLSETSAILTGVYAFFLCAIAILQPYKKNFYNFLDALLFLILTITSSNMLFMITYAQVNFELPNGVWPFTYVLLLIPTTYMVLYLIFWILTRFRARCCQQYLLRRLRGTRLFTGIEWQSDNTSEHSTFDSSSSPMHRSLESVCDSLPDRINNPYRYTTHDPGIFRERGPSSSYKQENATRGVSKYGAITH